MSLIIFLVIVILCTLLLFWLIGSWGGSDVEPREEWATIIGIGLILGSFLALPWVTYEPKEYFERNLQSSVGWIVQTLAMLEIDTPELISFSIIVQTSDLLTGLTLTWLAPIFSWLFWVTILGVALATLPALMRLFGQTILSREITRPGGKVQFGLALTVTLFFVYFIPRIDTLGVYEPMAVRQIALLSGARVSYGVWVALIGLLLLIYGGGRAINWYDVSKYDL